MTHPCLVSGLLPIDIRRVDSRLIPAWLIGNRKSGSKERRFKSVIVVHICQHA